MAASSPVRSQLLDQQEPRFRQLSAALAAHWPEYLMESAGLGLFMISACVFTVLLEHPASPLRQAIPDPLPRRALIGLAMGLTAVGIIYSPWGKQSGAHLNPSVTLSFFLLGKVRPWDAFFYSAAQFAGGVLGVVVARRCWVWRFPTSTSITP